MKTPGRHLLRLRKAPHPKKSRTISVLVAVVPGLIREGLRVCLGRCERTRIVGEAACVDAVEKMVRNQKTDVLVLDADMPGVDCGTLKTLHKLSPCLKVVALCSITSSKRIVDAYKAGVCGCITKDCAVRDVRDAIKKVMAGGYYFSSEITASVLDALASAKKQEGGELLSLTCGQREMLRLIGNGSDMKSIASERRVSDKAVYKQRHKLMEALGIHAVGELQCFAQRRSQQNL